MQFLSKRALSLHESATLAMSRQASELKAQGEDIINLSLGEPNFSTPAHICEAAIETIRSGQYFSYPPVSGYEDVRTVIAEKFSKENGIRATFDQIVVSTGAKQSIANIALATLNPGDEVVVSSPYWVSYPEIISLAEARAVYVQSYIEDHYKLRPEALQKALSARTKLFIFSSPSNPTGAVLTKEELEKLAEVLLQYPKVLIVSDEIYEYINFSGHHASIGAIEELSERCVTVNGLSKGFAMTGWRIGYIHAPKPIAKACEKIQGQITSGANSIAQRCVLSALQYSKESSKDMCNAYQKRSQLAHKLLGEIPGIKSYLPEGAYYMFPNISAYFGKKYGSTSITNSETLCMYLLKEAKVSTVSGSAFGDNNCIRFSFGVSEEVLEEAVHRIRTSLERLS